MKKILIVTAIAAAGAAAYFANQQLQTSPQAYNVLDYVPADTPLLSAQLKPFPLKDYLNSSPQLNTAKDQETLQNIAVEGDPQSKFFLSIAKSYQTSLPDTEMFLNTFGLADNIRAYFYMLGALPVLKIEVENTQAIWDLLDKAEQESGYSHRTGKRQETEYRAYRLNDSSEAQTTDLIISQNNGLLTITLNSSLNKETLLSSALGLLKAENPITESGILEEIASKYNFTDQNIAFINHQEIIKGLTSVNANQLARHLSLLFAQQDQENPLSAFRTAECQAELTTVANNWPRTVFGYTDLSVTGTQSTMDLSTVIESKNQTILTALQSLRGYIPQYTQNIKDNAFALGFGVDINQLSSATASILTDLKTPNYQCAPLQEIQDTLQQQGQNYSMMLGMAGGMANGLKGFSVAVLDYSISKQEGTPSLESLDALLSYSADNPLALFNSLKMFSPDLQRLQPPADGSAVDLSEFIPKGLNISPKMAIKGQNLVIYNGEKSEQQADLMSSEALTKNGLFTFSFDLTRMFDPIITATELSGESMPSEAMFLQNYNMRIKFDIDINQQGIVFNSHVSNEVKK
ncbi:conserved hypothetical protein [Psychromonas ingrahamii 37]|uniref:DUF3352 domain-containing protein n=1 Tax=Psychromonas ingrahamii (strain DSM 17664 / CCUG 51855 / 37) TaxID=357804 RepID=A1SYD4_PSYIN|nr:hypothetical protein [Psychromonas ingrahamii]ABM04499.1 conserved hypothetical protein [Psychromonas ingrahamii 37]